MTGASMHMDDVISLRGTGQYDSAPVCAPCSVSTTRLQCSDINHCDISTEA